MYRLIPKEIIDHKLYERDTFTQDIDFIINTNIYEYDMKEAGYNLIIYYELLDKETIEFLSTFPKKERHIRIGLLQRENRQLSKDLKEAFKQMRKKFFISNRIQERNILSIKKDALFIIDNKCEDTLFKNVEFVMKNRYTSFHKFDKYEFYYRNMTRKLDIKGVNDSKYYLHEDYFISFLKDIFHTLETSSNDRVISKLKRFAYDYKNKLLPYEFYRELNADCMYTLESDDNYIQSMEVLQGFNIDHSYNYMNYILKLIQRFFFSV